VRIERKDAQIFWLSQELFENVNFGNLRFGRCEVFALDRFINLVPVDRNMARRGNADFYAAGSYVEDRNFNFVSYNEAFIFFSCED
jgi:hypothetical protein